MFLEVKNFENLNRKVVFHPNTIFKNHHFDIIFHTFGALGHLLSLFFVIDLFSTVIYILQKNRNAHQEYVINMFSRSLIGRIQKFDCYRKSNFTNLTSIRNFPRSVEYFCLDNLTLVFFKSPVGDQNAPVATGECTKMQ